MKKINLNQKNVSISRETVSKIGEAFYQSPGVNYIIIEVSFKDGSSISFQRSESQDELERKRKEEKNE